MKIDSDTTKEWWLRFDQDDLIDAQELIDFVMYHKVEGSTDFNVDEKYQILSAWDLVINTIWEKDDD